MKPVGAADETPIELNEVSAGYGLSTVVRDTTLRIGHGITLLAAPNGAGKTTFLRLCAGILQAKSGHIRVLEDDPYANSGVRAKIGYLSHQVGLEPRLTVAENLEFWARMRGLAGQSRRSGVAEVITELDLGKLASAEAGTLSRGQRQRLSLARALIGRPRLLLLDEPATGLDPGWYEKVTGILETRVREQGASVLLASHDPRDHATGWRVLEIDGGVIRDRPHGVHSGAARYRVEVVSPVRIVQRGPWRLDYEPDDPRVMTVELAANGALAEFVAALEQVSATVASISLLGTLSGDAGGTDADGVLSSTGERQ